MIKMKVLSLKIFFGIVFAMLCLHTTFAISDQKIEKEGILNKLLAPGPLMGGHQKLEGSDCLSCHDAGKGVPNVKCLECHKEISKTLTNVNTFHGRKIKQQCIECHKDHQGRNFDSTKIDEEKFNHSETGYILTGKHEKIKCSECHIEKRKNKFTRKDEPHFLGLTTSCKSCHEKESKHYFVGQLKNKDCSLCHGNVSWKKDIKFDHKDFSDFIIEGAHTKISCNSCHRNTKVGESPMIYKWPNLKESGCLSCHSDFHGGMISKKFAGGNCTTCHNQNSFKISDFQHDQTSFVLRGKHKELSCQKCHGNTPPTDNKEKEFQFIDGPKLVPWIDWKSTKRECLDCHKDFHQSNRHQTLKLGNMSQCQTCHNEISFKDKLKFRHDVDTRFKVDGKHSTLKCNSCHTVLDEKSGFRKYRFEGLEIDNCKVCHKSPHLNTFSPKNLQKKCSTCHTTRTWKETRVGENFNHNFDTNFKIDGAHTKVNCKSCHGVGGKEKQVFKFDFADKGYCLSCHSNVHKGQFSSRMDADSCLKCHGTDTFKKVSKFNHDLTLFPLEGKHANVKNCTACHKITQEVLYQTKSIKRLKHNFQFQDDQKGMCTQCHENVHVGQFSPRFSEQKCQACHTLNSFKDRLPFNHDQTRFSLLGYHQKISCKECHDPTNVKFPNSSTYKGQFKLKVLHQNNCTACHKDVHRGEFGDNCTSCHSENKKWKSTKDFHKNFTLKGVHFTLKCTECHIDQRRLGGRSDNCQLCHLKDDPHRGMLTNCKDCHRQDVWNVTTFKHSLTNFPLRGMHRALSCDSCHSNGVYHGKSSDCISCHMKDKVRAVTPNHNLAGFESCNRCHNQFVFK